MSTKNRWRLMVVAVAMAMLAVGTASANLFGPGGVDPRYIQPRNGAFAAFRPIGLITVFQPAERVEDEVLSSGTGFMVSPCYALTTHHVAFGDDEKATIAEGETQFHVAEADGFGTRPVGAKPAVWGPYLRTGNDADDWALMRLDECVGRETGWLELADSTEELPRDRLFIAGFPFDREDRFLWSSGGCRLFRPDPGDPESGDTFYHNCASVSGNSGGPLFTATGNGLLVYAINEAEFASGPRVFGRYAETRANIAVDIRYVLPHIRDIIAEDAAGTANPARVGLPAGAVPDDIVTRIEHALVAQGCEATADGRWDDGDTLALDRFRALTDQVAVGGTPADDPFGWTQALYVLEALPSPACVSRAVVDVGVGETIAAALEPGDRMDGYGTYADCYLIAVEDARRLRVSVKSAAFDAFVEVGPVPATGTCNLLPIRNRDDDGGGGTDARLTIDVKPAVWVIRVTSYSAGETGAYELDVRDAE
ncbi:MAG: serine protease [Bauldia sp.]